MVFKGNLDIDPRGLIYESYRMEGISDEECRTVFLDWALGTPLGADMAANLRTLMDEYGAGTPDHPMTTVLREGLEKAEARMGRRGGAMGRRR
ncbi:MAG: hypothetical protein GY952_01610 [Rhodobacteraceae bacterium]|nr:hypothetical protein [Paracoccaceae bacterium]